MSQTFRASICGAWLALALLGARPASAQVETTTTTETPTTTTTTTQAPITTTTAPPPTTTTTAPVPTTTTSTTELRSGNVCPDVLACAQVQARDTSRMRAEVLIGLFCIVLLLAASLMVLVGG